jgi:hypothetical protein
MIKILCLPYWFMRFVWNHLSTMTRYYLKRPMEVLRRSWVYTGIKYEVTPKDFWRNK